MSPCRKPQPRFVFSQLIRDQSFGSRRVGPQFLQQPLNLDGCEALVAGEPESNRTIGAADIVLCRDLKALETSSLFPANHLGLMIFQVLTQGLLAPPHHE